MMTTYTVYSLKYMNVSTYKHIIKKMRMNHIRVNIAYYQYSGKLACLCHSFLSFFFVEYLESKAICTAYSQTNTQALILTNYIHSYTRIYAYNVYILYIYHLLIFPIYKLIKSNIIHVKCVIIFANPITGIVQLPSKYSI